MSVTRRSFSFVASNGRRQYALLDADDRVYIERQVLGVVERRERVARSRWFVRGESDARRFRSRLAAARWLAETRHRPGGS